MSERCVYISWIDSSGETNTETFVNFKGKLNSKNIMRFLQDKQDSCYGWVDRWHPTIILGWSISEEFTKEEEEEFWKRKK